MCRASKPLKLVALFESTKCLDRLDFGQIGCLGFHPFFCCDSLNKRV